MISALIRRMRQRRYGKAYLTTAGWYFFGLALAVFAAAAMREINLLMVLAGLMIGPFLYNYYGCRLNKEWFAIQRRFPESVHANEPFFLRLILTNCSVYTLFGLVARQKVVFVDSRASRKSNAKPAASAESETEDRVWYAGFLFCQLNPKAKQTESVRVIFQLPGQYQLEPIEIHSRFPLGLFECRVKLGKPQSFWVYPALGELLQPVSRWEAFSWDSTLSGGRRLSSQDGDFHSVVPWRNGESQRRIHWRSSARRGELIVKQFQTPLSGKLAILVDLTISNKLSNAISQIPPVPETAEIAPESVFAQTVSSDATNSPDKASSVFTPAENEFQTKLSLAATILHACCIQNRAPFPEGLQITFACSGDSRLSCSGRNDQAFYHRALKILSSASLVSLNEGADYNYLNAVVNELPSDTRVLLITGSDSRFKNENAPAAIAFLRRKFTQIIKTEDRSLEQWFRPIQ